MNPSQRHKALLVVPDINVIVSGVRATRGATFQMFNFWRTGSIRFATSPIILNRLERVFTYPKVQALTQRVNADVQLFLQEFADQAIIVPGNTNVQVSADPEDNTVFACAVEARADFIVSGDIRHVQSISAYQGIRAVSPREFVDMLTTNTKAA